MPANSLNLFDTKRHAVRDDNLRSQTLTILYLMEDA